MLRALPYYLLLIPLTVYYSLRQLLVNPETATARQKEFAAKTWARSLIRAAGVRIEADLKTTRGLEKFVVVSNHQSNFDIPVLFDVFREVPIRFVAKDTLFRIPIYGKALAAAGHISIDRSNRRSAMKSIETAVASAQRGNVPLIFPEGTRQTDLSQLGEFQIGGIVLALKCGLPVVPVIICGSGEVMPKGSFLVDPRRTIRVKALPPIDPTAYSMKDREQFKDDLRKMMDAAYRELRAQEREPVGA